MIDGASAPYLPGPFGGFSPLLPGQLVGEPPGVMSCFTREQSTSVVCLGTWVFFGSWVSSGGRDRHRVPVHIILSWDSFVALAFLVLLRRFNIGGTALPAFLIGSLVAWCLCRLLGSFCTAPHLAPSTPIMDAVPTADKDTPLSLPGDDLCKAEVARAQVDFMRRCQVVLPVAE